MLTLVSTHPSWTDLYVYYAYVLHATYVMIHWHYLVPRSLSRLWAVILTVAMFTNIYSVRDHELLRRGE